MIHYVGHDTLRLVLTIGANQCIPDLSEDIIDHPAPDMSEMYMLCFFFLRHCQEWLESQILHIFLKFGKIWAQLYNFSVVQLRSTSSMTFKESLQIINKHKHDLGLLAVIHFFLLKKHKHGCLNKGYKDENVYIITITMRFI